jgi:peptidoglycan LD-endopeptidase LytH
MTASTNRAGRLLAALVLLPPLAGCGVLRANPDVGARERRPAAARPELAPEMAAVVRALAERRLMVPVAGVRIARVPDSYHEARGGGRIHQAVDILAPRGTPVVSADDGRVLRLRSNSAGGITIYAVDPDERFVYYYAHLDRYRDGLAEGTRVAKGEVIGYVGTTGNAPRDTPHLHFQVMRLDAGTARWWDGTPLDPRPYFAMDGAQR